MAGVLQMKEIIKDISNSFINEALASPRMLEDLAAMEKYMSESYDGRTFVELLQNADDAQSSRVKVFLADDALIVANDGRPFNAKDVMAICRSGASSKQRGNNIGYRGVGFKSATTISTEIVIHSSSTYFTFSKSVCARRLDKSASQVPTVRIPFLYDEKNLNKSISSAIKEYKKDGFTTFFIFNNAKMAKFLTELDGFDSGWLIFLRNIVEVAISCGTFKKECSIKRKNLSDTDALLSADNSKEQWYVLSKDSTAIAFKYDTTEGIIPCEKDEAVFHCFLPTIDKTGFPFKANADFSTDPSRKHIIQDESTSNALRNIQKLYADTIQRTTKNADKKLFATISLLNTHTTLSTLTTQFEKGLLDELRSSAWVPLNSNRFVKPENAKLFPKWLDSTERNAMCNNAGSFASTLVQLALLQETERLEVLLGKLGATELTPKELSVFLTNIDNAQSISAQLLGKIFVYCYRSTLIDEQIIRNFFVPLTNSYVTISKTTANTELHNDFTSVLKSLLNVKEVESLSLHHEVFLMLKTEKKFLSSKRTDGNNSSKEISITKFAINKWKTPIQNCVAIESLNGNSAKDVSRKCDEYDVISTDVNGITSYIAIKTVGILGDSFKLTESEYAAAQRYGEQYKVYLFTTDTSNIKYSIIINPINTIRMKKVVKEWEWICGAYESDSDKLVVEDAEIFETTSKKHSFNVDFDNMDGQQFERFCARLLIKNGYEDVSLTKTSSDQGVDIIAYKDGIKYGIQCKCYSSDIGNNAVQEVFAGKVFYKCNIGIVLTNQHFSSSAIKLAENSGVVLWGREMLLKLLNSNAL